MKPKATFVEHDTRARALPIAGAIARWAALLALAVVATFSLAPAPARAQNAAGACPPLLQHTFASLQTGEPRTLCQYRGNVLLVVNTASFCGFTGQYEGLEALYRKYRARGLVVLGFPANDFGGQEPGSNREIAQFCRTSYGIEFPMFEKSDGRLAAKPFYAELIRRSGEAPSWNFHKYLIDRSGQKVQAFKSAVEPNDREFVRAIERLLDEKPAG